MGATAVERAAVNLYELRASVLLLRLVVRANLSENLTTGSDPCDPRGRHSRQSVLTLSRRQRGEYDRFAVCLDVGRDLGSVGKRSAPDFGPCAWLVIVGSGQHGDASRNYQHHHQQARRKPAASRPCWRGRWPMRHRAGIRGGSCREAQVGGPVSVADLRRRCLMGGQAPVLVGIRCPRRLSAIGMRGGSCRDAQLGGPVSVADLRRRCLMGGQAPVLVGIRCRSRGLSAGAGRPGRRIASGDGHLKAFQWRPTGVPVLLEPRSLDTLEEPTFRRDCARLVELAVSESLQELVVIDLDTS